MNILHQQIQHRMEYRKTNHWSMESHKCHVYKCAKCIWYNILYVMNGFRLAFQHFCYVSHVHRARFPNKLKNWTNDQFIWVINQMTCSDERWVYWKRTRRSQLWTRVYHIEFSSLQFQCEYDVMHIIFLLICHVSSIQFRCFFFENSAVSERRGETTFSIPNHKKYFGFSRLNIDWHLLFVGCNCLPPNFTWKWIPKAKIAYSFCRRAYLWRYSKSSSNVAIIAGKGNAKPF